MSSETWPAWGTTRSGRLFRLPRLVPRTLGSECFSLPTPRASDARGSAGQRWKRRSAGQDNLRERAARERWPTPTANRWSGLQSHGRNQILGPLNPTWVEWLMGFPTEWTALELWETPLFLK